MRVDGFYAVGRETPGGYVVFLQTYMTGGMPTGHWGELAFANRYLMFKDAKKAAESAPLPYENGEPAAVWRIEVTATKEKKEE
jgi:hypothetical protein